MVVWLLSGGGDAEIRGLVPFFEKHFKNCSFKRLSPIKKKPGPRPGKKKVALGATGKQFVADVKKRLHEAVKYEKPPDLIFIFDDLDCKDYETSYRTLLNAISSVEKCNSVKSIISFAAPELEAWIIASWDNSVAQHSDFKMRHERMRYWLSTHDVPFDSPEQFSSYDEKRGTCIEKLSSLIIESSMCEIDDQNRVRYSKGHHTPALLRKVNIVDVKNKCPIFNSLINELNDFFSE